MRIFTDVCLSERYRSKATRIRAFPSDAVGKANGFPVSDAAELGRGKWLKMPLNEEPVIRQKAH